MDILRSAVFFIKKVMKRKKHIFHSLWNLLFILLKLLLVKSYVQKYLLQKPHTCHEHLLRGIKNQQINLHLERGPNISLPRW